MLQKRGWLTGMNAALHVATKLQQKLTQRANEF